MMSHLPILPILLPLFGGFILLFAHNSGLNTQRSLNLLFTFGLLLLSLLALKSALNEPYQVYLLSNWIAPFGIVLVLDKLSAMMLVLTSVLALSALVYGISEKIDKNGRHFHVLYQLQLFGLAGAFLTGDLFNLFVFFEVLLLASYGLLLHGGGRLRTKAGLHYVVINVIGSTLFLFAVGALYGIIGTLNIADLANKMAAVHYDEQGIVAAAALLLLVVFGIKAAMFPLYLWLPAAYAHTSACIAALFAIMTKVGLYAIIRVHGTLFSDQAGFLANLQADILLWLGMLTLILAVLGIVSARTLKVQVAYLVLASVATLIMGIGLNTEQALSATLYYLLHSTLIGGAMFMLADIIAKGRGSTADKLRKGRSLPSLVVIGSLYVVMAVAITGMPPLSGFIGKILLLNAALEHPHASWIYSTVLISSLLMIFAMARSGSLIFYKVIDEEGRPGKRVHKWAYASFTFLLLCSPMLVIFAGPVTHFTDSVAAQMSDTTGYIQAVLSQPASAGGR